MPYLFGFGAITAVVIFWALWDLAHSPLGSPDDETE
jgi:hypothetical protein